MTAIVRFVQAMMEERVPVREQVVGVVWFQTFNDTESTVDASALAGTLEGAGHAAQNKTRLREQLEADKRVIKRGSGFRASGRHAEELSRDFQRFTSRRAAKYSDSVLPRELFDGTRGYIERVVAQINGSYDHGYFDCCAVMCRRLGETLIIEVYEQQGRADEIKGSDGNFHMLNGLLFVLSKDKKVNLGRNSKKGLDDLKELGDKSAHNRRFNARQSDIDAVRTGLRTASEELLHIAGLVK